MYLSHEVVKNMLGSLVYVRAQETLNSGKVQAMNASVGARGTSIEAVVGDLVPNSVEINLPSNDDTVFASCSCTAYSIFGKCKHIGAVLLKFIDEQAELAREEEVTVSGRRYAPPAPPARRSAPERRVANNPGAMLLLTKYAEADDAEADELTRLIPQLKFEGGVPQLGFSIGGRYRCVLPDLNAFQKAMNLGETRSYSSKVTVCHRENRFDEKSRRLIDMIKAFINEQSMYARSGAPSEIRWMPVSARAFDELFDIFSGEEISGTESGQKWRMADENPNLSILSRNVNDHVEIVLEPPATAIQGAKYDYALAGSTIYRMTEDYAEAMLPLMDIAQTTSLMFSPKGASEFAMRVLPVVEKHAPLKESEGLIPYLPSKLEVRFYIDLPKRSLLTAQPAFAYGTDILTPETPVENYPHIKRDEYREKAAVKALLAHFDPPNEPGREYTLTDEARMYEFLTKGMPVLGEFGEIFISDKLKNMTAKKPARMSVGVSTGEGVLNLNIDTGEFPIEELEELLSAIRKKRRFYRLKDGSFMNLDGSGLDALSNLSDNLGLSTKDLEKGMLEIPMSRAMYLDNAMKQDGDVTFNRDPSFKKVIRDFKTVDDSDFAVPERLDGILRNYQKTGFRWLKTLDAYRFGGILADDMGLGKTLQVLTYLLSTKQERCEDDGLPRPTLIICPASLILNWGEEAKKWVPELNVCLLCGDADSREMELMRREEYDLIVTSYDLVRRDIELHETRPYYACILDEAQYIKNHETQTFKAVKRIKSMINIAMTGTPVENRLSELWSIFDFLMPGYLYKYQDFRDRFELPIAKNADTQAQNTLRSLVSPFILRRMKKDVLTELPEKVETVQYVTMDTEQKKAYAAHVYEVKNRLDSAGSGDKLEILSMLTRLRQICCDPALFIENYKGESCKLEECVRMVDELTESGHNILIFSQFTSMLARIRERLSEIGIPVFTLQGDTPREERAELVKRFNAGEVPVFLISLKAGGTGLNLTRADTVIHYDPWWNIAAQNQATDRCYRMGQERKVQVYQLICKDSIEENILKLQSDKRALAESVTEDANGGIMSMSNDEIRKLLD